MGLVDQGLEEVKSAVISSGIPTSYADLAYAYVKAGKPEEARKLLEELLRNSQSESNGRRVSPTTIAAIYAVLHEKAKAMDWLEKAYEQRSGYLPAVASDSVFESLHEDPRFQALLEKTGLNKWMRHSTPKKPK